MMGKTELLSQLRVTMTATLCRLRVPAALLSGLSESDCLEVAQPADAAPAVELKVNGKLFARATLFEHEGCRFVRIIELVSTPAHGGYSKWRLTKNTAEQA